MREYYVYIVASLSKKIYVGVTNNLARRVFEHKHKLMHSFTERYHIGRLVYYEAHRRIEDAIAREKEIKSWRREKKLALIESQNPAWKDLSGGWHDAGTSLQSASQLPASQTDKGIARKFR